MPYTDLLRVTVLLTGAEATALAAITAVAANRDSDTRTLIVAAVWWLIALVVGFYLGRPSARRRGPPRHPRRRRSTATSLPPETPARISVRPPLADRRDRDRAPASSASSSPASRRSAPATPCSSRSPGTPARRAVLAIEQRDGVKFYVVPNSALRPIQLVRTPGLRSGRRAQA